VKAFISFLDVEVVKAQANPRLRWGVWLIVCLVLSWVSLVWSDWNRALYEELRGVEIRLDSLSEMEEEEVWQQRLTDIDLLTSSVKARLWRAATTGLAQARIQTELNHLIERDESTKLAVRMGTPQTDESLSELHVIKVQVGCNLRPQQLLTTLANIESNSKLLVIERLKLTDRGQRWNVDMVLAVYVLIPGQAT